MQTDTIHLRELKVRYEIRRDARGEPMAVTRLLDGPSACAAVLRNQLQDEPSEVFIMLCLSTKRHLIATHEVSRGTLDASLANPREVFRAALLANAHAIVLGHNHPSGNPSPSPDDVAVTRRLDAAGTVLGIAVCDHIIIGDTGYFSFRETGLL